MPDFEVDQLLSYQDMNELKKLYPSATPPSSPAVDEIYLDISDDPIFRIMKYNGSTWDEVATGRDHLWRDNTSDETESFFIQSGSDTFYYDAGHTVTFDIAFTATPRVVATSSGREYICGTESISTTGFQARNIKHDGGTGNITASWIAVGKKT